MYLVEVMKMIDAVAEFAKVKGINRSDKFLLALFFLWFCSAGTKVQAQVFPKSPQPWQSAYDEISVDEFEFSHPMTILNQEDLGIVKARLENNIEPQKSAYIDFIAEANEALTFNADAPETLEIPGGYEDSGGLNEARELLWRNGYPAYTLGLAYALTGDEAYAIKSKEILMHWANKGTTFTGGDRGLQLGSWFSQMLYAADLIYNYPGWTETEKTVFKTWWREECILNGDVLDVMRRKDNNWKDAGLLGIFAASVVLEDKELLHEALIQLKSYFYSRNDEFVRITGPGWKILKDDNGVYLPREVVRNDGSSGLTYTAYALTSMVQCFEIARYAGYDFWNDTTEQGSSIADLINQYYKWDIVNDPFPWGIPNKSSKRRNHYELANNFLPIAPEVTTFVESARPVVGREGDAFSTLNKGDMKGTDTIELAPPKDLKVTPQSSGKIQLEWINDFDFVYGIVIERKADSDFEEVVTLVSGEEMLLDTGLLASTTYTYRISVFNATSSATSSEVSGTTPEIPSSPPTAPSNLEVTERSSSEIKLIWQDNASTEEVFEIERSTGSSFQVIGIAQVNEPSFEDKSLESGVTYTYRVRARNGAGLSDYSNEASETTVLVGGMYNESEGILAMEAENGFIGSNWLTIDDEGASKGRFIEVSPEYNSSGDTPECEDPSCIVAYHFQIFTEGEYTLSYRKLSTGGENDSFFWRLDGGEWIRENGNNSGVGDWFPITSDAFREIETGTHFLELTYRENGTQLDKFVLQLSSLEILSGEGPSESQGGGMLPAAAPSNLLASAESTTEIRLQWSDNSSDEDGFVIQRTTDGGEFSDLAVLNPNETSFFDTNLTSETQYIYQIASLKNDVRSHFSFIADAKTLEQENVPPIASFSSSSISGTAPLIVSFDASESSDPDGDEITYTWDFGDGNTSEEVTPEHTFEEPGEYSVRLTVTDIAEASSEMVMNVEVLEAPLSAEVSQEQILVYPNPSHGMIAIHLEGKRESEIAVYSVSGDLVFFKKKITSNSKVELRLITGIYFVIADKEIVKKVIVH